MNYPAALRSWIPIFSFRQQQHNMMAVIKIIKSAIPAM